MGSITLTSWCGRLPRDVGVVVVAAGRGERLGGSTPKQYQLIGGVPMVLRSLRPFTSHPDVRHVVLDDESMDDDDGTDIPWLRSLARGWLERLLERVDAPPDRAVPVVRFGDAGQEILAHAVERRVDLVVIGRAGDGAHADGAPGVLPVGSTTRLVTWAAPCPVLVLPLDQSRPATGEPLGSGARETRGDSGVTGRFRTGLTPPEMLRRGAWRRDGGGGLEAP